MDETGAADVDGTGEESHSERLVMRDALECADEVCAFEILQGRLVCPMVKEES